MLQKIVVPLDGTPLAEQALPPAVSFAREEGAHLHLTTVLRSTSAEIQPSISLFDEAYLETVATRVRDAGVPNVSTQRLTGDKVVDALEAYRREVGAGLTVMCTHGRGTVERAWLGSVADGLIRASEAPVLLVRASPGGAPRDQDLRAGVRFKRVLVALDGSHFSRQALDPATQLGGKAGAVYMLARVIESPHGPGSTEDSDERLQKDRTLAEAKLALEVQSFSAGGYTVESVAEFAPSVAEGILALAASRRADVIVIATHGRSGVSRLILGSVADKVIRAADRPVLVVRPRVP